MVRRLHNIGMFFASYVNKSWTYIFSKTCRELREHVALFVADCLSFYYILITTRNEIKCNVAITARNIDVVIKA